MHSCKSRRPSEASVFRTLIRFACRLCRCNNSSNRLLCIYICIRVFTRAALIRNCPSEVRGDVWLGSGGGDFGEPHVDGDAIIVQGRRLQYNPGRADDYG